MSGAPAIPQHPLLAPQSVRGTARHLCRTPEVELSPHRRNDSAEVLILRVFLKVFSSWLLFAKLVVAQPDGCRGAIVSKVDPP